MKKMNLFLAETTYDALAGQAALEAIDVPQFCSAILTEFADRGRQHADDKHVMPSQVPNQNAVPDDPLPLDTVLQVLAVSRYVWVDGLRFSEAVNRTAKDFSVHGPTVRDKCTRRISLPNAPVDTSQFLRLLSEPPSLRDQLCQKFTKYKTEITDEFNKLMAIKPVLQSPPSTGNGTTKPAANISERELVQAIISTLRENGGAAPKSVVEDSVFQKFKVAFGHPYYQELVGHQVGFPGVPRWRKNIEFARNTARQTGLIKPPGESGRGIWALTEIGKKWAGE